MASNSAKHAQDVLMADFQALVRDTEKLLADTANLAGDQAQALREQMHERLAQARETLEVTQESLRERSQEALGSAEQYGSQRRTCGSKSPPALRWLSINCRTPA